MRITFYGVRGSFPVAHSKVVKVGGNTSCVALRAEGAPTLIFDGGSGLRRLGQDLMNEGFGDGEGKAAFLFSHTHWDHIQGFMYFAPFYREGNDVSVIARGSHDKRLQQVFAGQVAGDFFSYGLGGLRANLTWRPTLEQDTFSFGPYTIRTARLNHPGVAVGYRVELGGKAFVYLTDTAPYDDQLLGEGFHVRQPDTDPAVIQQIQAYGKALEEFVTGADMLLYDTFFSPEQYLANPHWGHSTPDEGIRLARQGGVGRFYCYHHHPEAWDDELEGRTLGYQRRLGGSDLFVGLAREGETVEL